MYINYFKSVFCYCLIATLITISSSIFAAQQTTAPKKLTIYCPSVEQITRSNQGVWSLNNRYGSWKSFNKSFATQLKQFMGAQWKGVGIGNLICIYQTGDDASFPVKIAYSILVKQPDITASADNQSKWQKKIFDNDGQKQVIFNCAAKDIKKCPFSPVLKKSTVNVNEALEKAKQNYKPTISPNL